MLDVLQYACARREPAALPDEQNLSLKRISLLVLFLVISVSFALFSVTQNYNAKKKLSPHPLHKLARLVRKSAIFLLTKIAKCL
jgi:hypothetical protein